MQVVPSTPSKLIICILQLLGLVVFTIVSVFQVGFEGEIQNGSGGPFNLICNSRLPKGLDPHSIPSEELAASLG